MKNVVITGSTRGIGFGLADAFLDLGSRVLVSGRSEKGTQEAATKLISKYSQDQVYGHSCDVRNWEEVNVLWDAGEERMGSVDIWVNNAGISGPQVEPWRSTPENVNDVINTNVTGTIFGSMVAVKEMLRKNTGSIYNMEGMGSDGRTHNGLAIYGTSKSAVRYYTNALIKETAGSGLIIGSLRPGMVVTDFVMDQYRDRPQEWERAKRIFNIIADRVENVAPWLAREMLANKKTGARISYLSTWKVLGRVLTSPFKRRDIFQVEDPS